NECPQALIAHAVFTAHTDIGIQVREANFVRGYCSTVEKKLYFYGYEGTTFTGLDIKLANGKTYHINEVLSDTTIKLTSDFSGFSEKPVEQRLSKKYFREVTDDHKLNLAYVDNKHNDFE